VQEIDQVGRSLATLDRESAARVGRAVEALLGPEGERMPLDLLSQLDVQDFLWRTLPTTATTSYDHHETAWALGDWLETVGRPRYAAICRDRGTHEILAAWHRDPELGSTRAAEAQQASGVLPPDTSLLRFGERLGPEEHRAFERASALLEEAVAQGLLLPAAHGFQRRSAGLVESFLRTPSGTFGGEPPLVAVRRERALRWAGDLDRRGSGWLAELLPTIEAQAETPDNVELSLAPARALLVPLCDGVTLTTAGYLPPALVTELDDRFYWSEDFSLRRPRSERDLPPLGWLRTHLEAQRLAVRRGGRLTASARGRRAVTDPKQLWAALTAPAPRWSGGFVQDALAVAAAVVLNSADLGRDTLVGEVVSLVGGRWRPSDASLVVPGVQAVWLDWYRVGLCLGWWDRRRGRWLEHRLSPLGRSAAAQMFWSVAGRPAELPARGVTS
jgi:hypothetical protein